MKETEFTLYVPNYWRPMLKEAQEDPHFSEKYGHFIKRVFTARCAGAIVTIKEDLPEIGLHQGQIVDTAYFCKTVCGHIKKLLKETGHYWTSKYRKRGPQPMSCNKKAWRLRTSSKKVISRFYEVVSSWYLDKTLKLDEIKSD